MSNELSSTALYQRACDLINKAGVRFSDPEVRQAAQGVDDALTVLEVAIARGVQRDRIQRAEWELRDAREQLDAMGADQ